MVSRAAPKSRRAIHALVGACFLIPAVSTLAQPAPTPQALVGTDVPALVEAELRSLGLSPRCAERAGKETDCVYRARSSMTQRALEAHAVARPESATVELYIADFLRAPAGAPGTAPLMVRLMELNAALLGVHFSWLPQTGEVRVVGLLHVDSNFDRRAFRSLVHTLDRIAPRYHAELQHLMTSAVSPPAQ